MVTDLDRPVTELRHFAEQPLVDALRADPEGWDVPPQVPRHVPPLGETDNSAAAAKSIAENRKRDFEKQHEFEKYLASPPLFQLWLMSALLKAGMCPTSWSKTTEIQVLESGVGVSSAVAACCRAHLEALGARKAGTRTLFDAPAFLMGPQGPPYV